MIKKILLGLLLATSLYAQTGVKPVDGTGTELQLGAAGKAYDSGITTLPAVAMAVTSVSTKVQQIYCANIDTVDRTVTITDNQGTPKVYLNAATIPVNGALLIQFGTRGLPFTSGIKWSASATTAINCQIIGAQ